MSTSALLVLSSSANLDFLVRMNFSHGEYSYHQSVIDNTRKMVAGKFLRVSIIFFAALCSLNPQPILMDVLSPLLLILLVFRDFCDVNKDF